MILTIGMMNKNSRNCCSKTANGFTLIEVLVSVAILSVSIVAIIQILAGQVSMLTKLRAGIWADMLTYQKSEEVRLSFLTGNYSSMIGVRRGIENTVAGKFEWKTQTFSSPELLDLAFSTDSPEFYTTQIMIKNMSLKAPLETELYIKSTGSDESQE